jgi:hypothetical protein
MKHQASLRVSKKMAEAILWDAVGTTDRGRPIDLYWAELTEELVVVFEFDDRRGFTPPRPWRTAGDSMYGPPEHLREDSVSIGGTD